MRFYTKRGAPDWSALGCVLNSSMPFIFRNCFDLHIPQFPTSESARALKVRTTEAFRTIMHFDSRVITGAHHALRAMNMSFLIGHVLDAVALHAEKLPIEVVFWGVGDEPAMKAAARHALEVATYLGTAVCCDENKFWETVRSAARAHVFASDGHDDDGTLLCEEKPTLTQIVLAKHAVQQKHA